MNEIVKKGEINKMMVGILISEHEEKLYEAASSLKQEIKETKRKLEEFKDAIDENFLASLCQSNPGLDFSIKRTCLDLKTGEFTYFISFQLRVGRKVIESFLHHGGTLPDMQASSLVDLALLLERQRADLTAVNHELNNISRKERKIKAALDKATLKEEGLLLNKSVRALLDA